MQMAMRFSCEDLLGSSSMGMMSGHSSSITGRNPDLNFFRKLDRHSDSCEGGGGQCVQYYTRETIST
jgi:hypothetical protein